MYEHDISKEAKNVLRELGLLKKEAKKQKTTLADMLIRETLSMSNAEIKELIFALRELDKIDYIAITATMDACVPEISYIDSLKIKHKGRKYIRLFMKYEGGLEMNYRKKPLTVERILQKASKNGFYIILVAIIPIICTIIDTIINIINNLK